MTTLSVPDMSCGHCKASVAAALAGVPGADRVDIDLTARRVRVDGPAAPAGLIAALDAVGFPATVAAD